MSTSVDKQAYYETLAGLLEFNGYWETKYNGYTVCCPSLVEDLPPSLLRAHCFKINHSRASGNFLPVWQVLAWIDNHG